MTAPSSAAAPPAHHAVPSLNDMLVYMAKQEASDLHLKPMRPPLIRVRGRLIPIPGSEPLKPADALFRLLQGLVNARNFPDGGLAAASRLVKQVRAWQLSYSDLESAAAWIQQTLAD